MLIICAHGDIDMDIYHCYVQGKCFDVHVCVCVCMYTAPWSHFRATICRAVSLRVHLTYRFRFCF